MATERNGESVIPSEQTFVRSQAVVSHVVAGETLIVPVRGQVGDLASIYSFNETGSLIWKLLDAPRCVPEIVSVVAEAYSADTARVREDVLRFLDEMRAAALIEVYAVHAFATKDLAGESFLAEVPGTAVVSGTEGPVGREGLVAADAR